MNKSILRQYMDDLLMITIKGYDLNDLNEYLQSGFKLIHSDRTYLIFVKVFDE
jgi:hypothetical protein|nr:MAG TPA: hypothetical protein [Caudoviricetes sp.]